jgi:hypothetical protein
MSVSYRRDLPRPVVVITWPEGQPDIRTVQSTVDAIFADANRPAELRILSDWSQSMGVPDTEYVQGFVWMLHDWGRRGLRQWATVVRPDSVASYGMGRMVEIRADDADVAYRVFRDLDDAIAWLGTGVRSGARDPGRE